MSLRDNLVAIGLNLPENLSLDLEQWAGKLGESPCRNTVTLVGLSAVMFYLVEKNHNPKVNDVWDAMVYCSTCLSVGYGDIFAKTPLGKILGSALMTLGPNLSGRTLEGEGEKRRDELQEQTLQTLRKILSTLEANVAT
jgi:Ion channel